MKKVILLIIAFLPSSIRLWAYRAILGARIGKNSRIGFGAILLVDSICIGSKSSISSFVLVKASTLVLGDGVAIGRFVRIGAHSVTLDHRSSLGEGVRITGNPKDARCVLEVGICSWIFEGCYINVTRPIFIGRNVGIGGHSMIFAHGLWLSQLQGFPIKNESVWIENNVWLPWRCFVMPGVRVGEEAIIGACSVITKDIPPRVIAAGVPAKIIKDGSRFPISNSEIQSLVIKNFEEFAVDRGFTIVTERFDEYADVLIDGVHAASVGTSPRARTQTAAQAVLLIVVPGGAPHAIKENTAMPIFFTSDGRLINAGRATSLHMQWLEHARVMGVRFFPDTEHPLLPSISSSKLKRD